MDSWQRFSLHPDDDQYIRSLFDFNVDISFPGVSGSFSEITVARYKSRSYIQGNVVVVKSSSRALEASTEPHDICRELRILSSLSHINIIEILGHHFGEGNDALHFWMPRVTYKLASLLNCPAFSPHPVSADGRTETATTNFEHLARSLLFQLIAAVAYLHHPAQGVAHRDIKAANVLISKSGCIKLIDFGVSWAERISASSNCLWPEPPGMLCFDVSTGVYRAPELLFGTRNYDPYATDLWSLGVLCSEFFTAIKHRELDSDSDSDEEEDGEWVRDTLFDSTRGSIGLAWSIFKIRGTPNEENWPTFTALPDGSKVSFQDVPAVDLTLFLPNVPPGDSAPFTGSHSCPPPMISSPIDLIYRFLVYPPEQRLRAKDALRHPWFTSRPLILPSGYPEEADIPVGRRDDSLEDMLANMMAHVDGPEGQRAYSDSEVGLIARDMTDEEESMSI